MCNVCGTNKATEIHHKLKQSKLNKRLYPSLIHNPDNLIHICYLCHHTKNTPRWSEQDFCKHFGIIPRSKSGLDKYNRGTL